MGRLPPMDAEVGELMGFDPGATNSRATTLRLLVCPAGREELASRCASAPDTDACREAAVPEGNPGLRGIRGWEGLSRRRRHGGRGAVPVGSAWMLQLPSGLPTPPCSMLGSGRRRPRR